MNMLAQLDSSSILGPDAYIVKVEVDISRGLPSFNIVGLPDMAVQESRERVRAAIKNSNFEFPMRRITVNLAPADVKKEGPAFDLPIALGIMAATNQLKNEGLQELAIVGELSLDGAVRPVSGVLPISLAAKSIHKRGIIVPIQNAKEAALVGNLEVYPVESLFEATQLLNNEKEKPPFSLDAEEIAQLLREPNYDIDISEVKGQDHAKRALEVAAAGGHNIIMIGPPGSGKTMLARRLPTILPSLTLDEALEATKLYSISGLLASHTSLISTRPFRSPHHTVSTAGLVGGGSIPKPGEISLAHHGVLFLDELPEFRRDGLEVLRQPLEDGMITISRATTSITYPARFMLVSAMNPCPCGYYTDPVKQCICTPHQIHNYRMKISGPLLDRIDIHIEVPRLRQDELMGYRWDSEDSKFIRDRVERARKIQQERFKDTNIYCNAHMSSKQIRKYCQISQDANELLRSAIDHLNLSARAYDRVLKLSRTISDLEGKESIEIAHLAEAIQYRSLDRKFWS